MVTALEIIRALGGNEHTGMCRCPAHDDRTPSLHVSTSDTGKVLLHCLAGCPQQVVFDIILKPRLGRGTRPKVTKQREYEMGEKERQSFAWARMILRATQGMIGPVQEWGQRGDRSSLKPYLRNRHIDKIPANALYLAGECPQVARIHPQVQGVPGDGISDLRRKRAAGCLGYLFDGGWQTQPT
jgi:hypothetical protein